MIEKVKIIGVDPGAVRCGFSIIQFDLDEDTEKFSNPVYLDSGHFGLRRDEDETYSQYKSRLITNAIDVFQDKIEEHDPDLFVFEFMPITNSGAAGGQRLLAFVVAVAGQVISELNGVYWTEITATTVKKQMTDSGTAKKTAVKNAVLEVFPELQSRKFLADETDAIAVPLAWTKRKNAES
jgi:Holliday junction resolvasome RuvABC endonuclease subunit